MVPKWTMLSDQASLPYDKRMGSGRSSAVTLRDVAARAGVNTTTASVVLNSTRSGTRVSDATRQRIMDAAAELGYRANAAARGMKHRRMNTIGVVDVIDGDELNLYFLEVLNGILEEAARHEQNTTVFSVTDWKEERILQFCDGRVDGLILIGPIFEADTAETLQRYAPLVTLHSNHTFSGASNLGIDDEQGGYIATRHLIERGHRRIMHFSAPLSLSGPQKRLAGYRRALAEAGLPYEESLVRKGWFTQTSGFESMSAVIQEGGTLPTAVFCANDAIASGCMDALTAHNLRVPEDISVVGFDDTLTARMTTPPLTTVRQPFRKLGQRAVQLLLAKIDNNVPTEEGEQEPKNGIFPVELVVRKSTAPPSR